MKARVYRFWLEVTKSCREITGNHLTIGSDAKNRPGDIAIYLSNNKKVSSEFAWQPRNMAKDILSDIYRWIRLNEKQIKAALL